MDKASVALSATEDNAAAIRELNKKLYSRTACKVITGKTSGGFTLFGNITSSGNTAVIVVFSGTATNYRLLFGGETIAISPPPIVAVLPEGSGELKLTGARTAFALVIG